MYRTCTFLSKRIAAAASSAPRPSMRQVRSYANTSEGGGPSNQPSSSGNAALKLAGVAAILGGAYWVYSQRAMHNAHDAKAAHIHASPDQGNLTLTQKTLDAGAMLMQKFKPVNKIHEHVCGFHFYSGDTTRQVEAHHFCSHINADMRQCVIYDSDEPNAKLIGIEYVISRRLFETLPEEEKPLWHSHVYEVKSGSLVAPHLPTVAENAVMNELVDTYGKTWHTWQVDRGDAVPLGVPQLMMAFTRDGQAKPEMLAKRDAKYGISTGEKRKAREESVRTPTPHSSADAWMSGKAIQMRAEAVDAKK